MADEKASERAAVKDMTPGHHDAHSQHMFMTAMRDRTPEDVQRARRNRRRNFARASRNTRTITSRSTTASESSCRISRNPNITSPAIATAFWKRSHSIPRAPLPCSTRKPPTGYELVGAMYTMPKRATEDQLNARVPLSVAMWHLHTNLCMPPRANSACADWTKFGLHGSIVTKDACYDAGGRFHPVIFGWMVHVYPYEEGLDNIFAMHHHMD